MERGCERRLREEIMVGKEGKEEKCSVRRGENKKKE